MASALRTGCIGGVRRWEGGTACAGDVTLSPVSAIGCVRKDKLDARAADYPRFALPLRQGSGVGANLGKEHRHYLDVRSADRPRSEYFGCFALASDALFIRVAVSVPLYTFEVALTS